MALRFRAKKSNRPLFDPDEILMDSAMRVQAEDLLDKRIERPMSRVSAFLLLAAVAISMLYLGWRAYALQIVSGKKFFQQSQQNRFVTRSIFPPRGLLYDRNKIPMVENVPSFGLTFEKDDFMQKHGDLRPLTSLLADILHKDESFFTEAGFPEDRDSRRAPLHLSLVHDLSLREMIDVSARLDSLPGVQITERFSRRYRYPLALAHLLGFVGKISDEDIRKNPELAQEETIGKAGVEAFYDELLRGKGGKKIVEIDSMGNETKFRLTHEPQAGTPLILTVDQELQNKLYALLDGYANHQRGASAVILDVNTGAVRALASFPGFDTNHFAANLPREEFNAIIANPLKPLFNRAIGGAFPSGSTIKPLIAAAALQEGLIDVNAQIYDEGFIAIPNPYHPGQTSIFKDWRKHGWINFYDAIAQSANVYFYMIGGGYKNQKGLGITRIKQYANAFGLGARLGIDLPGEQDGFIPDPASKALADTGDSAWRLGDTYNVAIGQGGLLATPLQMAALTAAIANNGTLYQPHVLDATLNAQDAVVARFESHTLKTNLIKPEYLNEVRQGMRQVVTRGTAQGLQSVPVAVAAKTGTAQAGPGLPHAWVTAFAPFDHPEIALAIMVEHAGEGSSVAVPIAREILSWYFTHHADGGSNNP